MATGLGRGIHRVREVFPGLPWAPLATNSTRLQYAFKNTTLYSTLPEGLAREGKGYLRKMGPVQVPV